MRTRRLLAVACAALGLVGASAVAPAAADPAPWTPAPIVAPSEPAGILLGVTCPAATLCLSVGTVDTPAGTTTTFAQRWNGTAWSRVAAASPAGAVAARLVSVSCISPTNCLAVGYWQPNASSYNVRPLAERWNGTSWRQVTVIPPAGDPTSQLTGVSCVASGTCVAVGWSSGATSRPFATTWTGTAWQNQPTPPVGSSLFLGVSCTAGTRCVAVGWDGHSVVGRFDGTTWTRDVTPDIGWLTAVSCTTTTFCVAVAGNYNSPRQIATGALHYDGTVWTAVATPHASPQKHVYELHAVSCRTATDCTAVGEDQQPYTAFTASLIQHWDGTSWTAATVPQQTPATNNLLFGLACTASSCTAVGRFGGPNVRSTVADNPELDARPLVLGSAGSAWALQDDPGPKTTRSSALGGISCPTATFCVATGRQGLTWGLSGLIEVWNGTTWSFAKVPAGVVDVGEVSCATANACLALGSVTTSDGAYVNQTLLRWNGSSWTLLALPPKATDVVGVSCDAANSCTTLEDGSRGAYHWNGTTWTRSALPTLASGSYRYLVSLSCTSAVDCVAVGYVQDGSPRVTRPVTFVRSGFGWNQYDVGPSGSTGTLTSVSCVTATACTAVGRFSTDASGGSAVAASFDGVAWTPVSAPADASSWTLTDVSCTAATTCHAIGSTTSPTQDYQLVEAWDGSTWTRVGVTLPAGIAGPARLVAVSCAAGGRCFAPGSIFVADGGFRPFVLSGTA